MNSNTKQSCLQQNVVNTTLLFNTIRAQLGGIESETYVAMSFSEIMREKADRLNEVRDGAALSVTLTHLDTLAGAMLRSLGLILDAAAAASLALSDAEGGAQ